MNWYMILYLVANALMASVLPWMFWKMGKMTKIYGDLVNGSLKLQGEKIFELEKRILQLEKK